MLRPALDPALLPTFLAVLDAGRISAAAKTVHLSQPAVTAQIRRLEEALGAPLFVRSVRGVTPTEAGQRLATHARALRRLLDEAIADVSPGPGDGDARLGPLVVAASTTIAAHLLPSLLAQFRAVHPDVGLRLRVGNTEEVVEHVRAGRAPLGLVEGHRRAAGIRLEPFVDDEIVAIVGGGGARVGDAPFRLRRASDLAEVPLLWREPGSGTRAVVERALRQAGVHRHAPTRSGHAADGARDVELGSTEAVVGGVVAGLGVAFVSRRSIRAHLAAGLVRLVPGLELVIKRTFYWALPAGGLRGTAARFHAFVQRAPLA